MAGKQQRRGLSHADADGNARMVDVSGKEPSAREATASARLRLKSDVLDLVFTGALPKGEVLGTARVAGILAAKRCSEWIPMCHPLPLDWVQIDFHRTAPGELKILCAAKTNARTGVEMEAMVGVASAALTIYDMAKAADKTIVIGPIQLERKTGGKGGTFERQADALPPDAELA